MKAALEDSNSTKQENEIIKGDEATATATATTTTTTTTTPAPPDENDNQENEIIKEDEATVIPKATVNSSPPPTDPTDDGVCVSKQTPSSSSSLSYSSRANLKRKSSSVKSYAEKDIDSENEASIVDETEERSEGEKNDIKSNPKPASLSASLSSASESASLSCTIKTKPNNKGIKSKVSSNGVPLTKICQYCKQEKSIFGFNNHRRKCEREHEDNNVLSEECKDEKQQQQKQQQLQQKEEKEEGEKEEKEEESITYQTTKPKKRMPSITPRRRRKKDIDDDDNNRNDNRNDNINKQSDDNNKSSKVTIPKRGRPKKIKLDGKTETTPKRGRPKKIKLDVNVNTETISKPGRPKKRKLDVNTETISKPGRPPKTKLDGNRTKIEKSMKQQKQKGSNTTEKISRPGRPKKIKLDSTNTTKSGTSNNKHQGISNNTTMLNRKSTGRTTTTSGVNQTLSMDDLECILLYSAFNNPLRVINEGPGLWMLEVLPSSSTLKSDKLADEIFIKWQDMMISMHQHNYDSLNKSKSKTDENNDFTDSSSSHQRLGNNIIRDVISICFASKSAEAQCVTLLATGWTFIPADRMKRRKKTTVSGRGPIYACGRWGKNDKSVTLGEAWDKHHASVCNVIDEAFEKLIDRMCDGKDEIGNDILNNSNININNNKKKKKKNNKDKYKKNSNHNTDNNNIDTDSDNNNINNNDNTTDSNEDNNNNDNDNNNNTNDNNNYSSSSNNNNNNNKAAVKEKLKSQRKIKNNKESVDTVLVSLPKKDVRPTALESIAENIDHDHIPTNAKIIMTQRKRYVSKGDPRPTMYCTWCGPKLPEYADQEIACTVCMSLYDLGWRYEAETYKSCGKKLTVYTYYTPHHGKPVKSVKLFLEKSTKIIKKKAMKEKENMDEDDKDEEDVAVVDFIVDESISMEECKDKKDPTEESVSSDPEDLNDCLIPGCILDVKKKGLPKLEQLIVYEGGLSGALRADKLCFWNLMYGSDFAVTLRIMKPLTVGKLPSDVAFETPFGRQPEAATSSIVENISHSKYFGVTRWKDNKYAVELPTLNVDKVIEVPFNLPRCYTTGNKPILIRADLDNEYEAGQLYAFLIRILYGREGVKVALETSPPPDVLRNASPNQSVQELNIEISSIPDPIATNESTGTERHLV